VITGHASCDLQIYQTPTETYLQFKGRIVLEDCERLRSLCVPAISKGGDRVFIDLAQVDYIDSAGLSLLVGLKMTCKKSSSRIILLQPSRPVSDILFITKLDGIFEVVSGPEASTIRSRLAIPENLPGANAELAGGGGSQESIPGIHTKLDKVFPDLPRPGAENVGEDMSRQEQIEEYCRKAVDYMREGNYEMASEEYRNALTIDPDYLPVLNNLAIVYEKKPSWLNLAVEQWEKVVALSQQRGDQKHFDRANRHLANLRKMQG